MSGGVGKTLAGSKRKGCPGEGPGEGPGVCAKMIQVWSELEDKIQEIMDFEAQIDQYNRQYQGILFQNMTADPAYDLRNSLPLARNRLKELEKTLEELCKKMTAQDVKFLVGAFGKMLEKHEQERENLEEDAQRCHYKLTRCNTCIMHLTTFRDTLMQKDTVSTLEEFGFLKSVQRIQKEEAQKDQHPYQGPMLVYIGAFPDVPKEIPLAHDINVIGRWPRYINTPGMNSQNQPRMVGNSHANIIKKNNVWILVDLASSNGTQVRIDGSDVRVETHDLQDKDIITFGGAHGVAFGASPPSTHTASGYVYMFEAGEF